MYKFCNRYWKIFLLAKALYKISIRLISGTRAHTRAHDCNSFIEVQFAYRIVRPLKVCGSLTSVYSQSVQPSPQVTVEHLVTPKRNSTPLSRCPPNPHPPYPPHPQPLTTTTLLFVSIVCLYAFISLNCVSF